MPRHVPDTFFGHPRPLSTLFHIELWERFSYYGMQSILLIYLYYEVTRGGLGIDQGLAGGIVGIYGGSVYLATILGGWLADRVLGAERTLFYSGIVVMLGHIALALVPGNFSSVVLGVNIVAVLGYFGRMLLGSGFSASEKRHVLAYVPLFLAACVFWMLWFQVFTSVVVYFDETVVRRFGDWEAPVSWSASAQSLWVIILAGTMATLWTKLGDRQPRTPMKFVLSLFVLAAGYYCFVPYIKAGEPMSMLVFVGVLFLVTVAELLISPIAISLATKIAPASFRTQMVAVNFLSLSLGFTAGGVLFDAHYSKEAAADFYVELTVISLVCAVALLVLVPVLNRMLKDVD